MIQQILYATKVKSLGFMPNNEFNCNDQEFVCNKWFCPQTLTIGN